MSNEDKKPKIRFDGFTDDWEQRKLEEWGTFYYGHSCPKWSVTADATTPCIRYGELYTKFGTKIDRVFSYTNIPTDKLRFSKGTEVLIPRVGEDPMDYNHCTWLSMPNVAIGEMISVFNTEQNPLFTATMFNATLQKEFAVRVEGGSVTNLYYEKLKNIDVSFPQKEEQEIIASFFEQIDNLITLHQRKYDKLLKIKKSMLQKMFPQNGSSFPEIRFAGFTDAWEQRKLSEVATMHARIGWQNLRTSEFLESGDYLLVTGTDFEDGRINYATCHYVERERYEQDKHIQLENGCILITKDGTLGKVAYVQGLSMPATLNAGVFNVVIKDEKEVNGKYLFQYLKAPFLMDYVDKKATGGTIKHLNQNILVDFPVVMPCVDEQALIGTYFDNLDHLITLHQRKLNKLKNIKKSMLEKMFV